MKPEQRLRNRLIFKVTGRWPNSVVNDRLANTTWDPTNVNAILADIYERAGMEYVPLKGRQPI